MQSRIEYEGHDGTIIAQVESTVDIKLKDPLDRIGNELELIGDGMSDYVSLDWPIPPPRSEITVQPVLFITLSDAQVMS